MTTTMPFDQVEARLINHSRTTRYPLCIGEECPRDRISEQGMRLALARGDLDVGVAIWRRGPSAAADYIARVDALIAEQERRDAAFLASYRREAEERDRDTAERNAVLAEAEAASDAHLATLLRGPYGSLIVWRMARRGEVDAFALIGQRQIEIVLADGACVTVEMG